VELNEKMMHPRIAWLLDRVSGSRILDVGYVRKQDVLLRGFRERNPQADVIGIDLDMKTVLITQDELTLVGDAFKLPFADGEFDAVVAGELLEHVWNGFALLRELARVSCPNGAIYITTPNSFSLNRWFRYCFLTYRPYTKSSIRFFLGDADHKAFWNPPSLLNALDGLGLEIVEATTIGIRIPFVARVVQSLGSLHLPWYPFSRLGSYLCVWGRKRHGRNHTYPAG
jgi:SAM-dependent methyltransferase